MKKKFVFNRNKKRVLGDDAYLVRAGLRCKKAVPLLREKKSLKEINLLKEAKNSCKKGEKMVTIVKTHCNG